MARFLLIVAAAFGFLLTIAFANLLVPVFRFAKNKRVQGVSWRAQKAGLPTMGGLCFVLASLLAIVIAQVGLALVEPEMLEADWTLRVQLAVASAFLFGAVGFVDDLVQLVRKQPAGLTALLKYLCEAAVTLIVMELFARCGMLSSEAIFPVVGYVNFGTLYYPVLFVFAMFLVHSISLTDRVEGLCISCSFVTLLGFATIAVLVNEFEAALFPSALAGCLVAFLLWNFYPAKIHMGSVGNLFLAGAIFGVWGTLNTPGLLLLFGIPYLIEGVFAWMQGVYYLIRRKKLFPAATLSGILFEKGWGATKICCAFGGISLASVLFVVLFMRLG